MKHLALAVHDQERSRRFYETYLGFDASPARNYDGGVLMLYNADGFSLALGPTDEPINLPSFSTSGSISRALMPSEHSRRACLPRASRSPRSGRSPNT